MKINTQKAKAEKLADLDFVDNIVFMSHTRSQKKDNSNMLTRRSQQLVININIGEAGSFGGSVNIFIYRLIDAARTLR